MPDLITRPQTTAVTMAARRFDLPAIEAALHALQRAFPRLNPDLKDRREPLGDDVVGNMLAAYALVDRLIANDVDLLAFGQLKWWLEINALVLCGTDPAQRARVADHLEATEERFYDSGQGGIRDVIEWHERSTHQSVWKRAAGIYIRLLSEPQLFPEGNHRSGTLLMSYILGREGKPPVVLTPDNAAGFFDPSTAIKQIRKQSLAMMIGMTGLKRHFAEFLKAQADERYLLPPR